jgi:transcriptional regulator with XRE-family HTH domain
MLTFALSSTLTRPVCTLYGMNSVGERLKRAREEAKLTQQELAERIGATRSAIAQVESGTSTSLNAENLAKAAQALGKSAVWLATGEGREHDLAAQMAPLLDVLDGNQIRTTVQFFLYQVEQAMPAYVVDSQKAKSYTNMIERLKRDMGERNGHAPITEPIGTKK